MKSRVLIVDDSSFFRKRLTEIISADSHLEVAGTAVDGVDAIDKVKALKPDVITMDIEMPRMDGITAVKTIMQEAPTPILMLSSLTTAGAQATFDALDAGALDYLPKNIEEISNDRTNAKKILCARIRILAARGLKAKNSILPQKNDFIIPTKENFKPRMLVDRNIKLIIIGASTGGPSAIQLLLSNLSKSFPIPILVVQHMPAAFTGPFAVRLNNHCAINVKEAADGDVITSGNVYIAPGGKQMTVSKSTPGLTLSINNSDPSLNYKPCIDITLNSVEKVLMGNVLTIILTGMGADGREGVRVLKNSGALIWVQDEQSSVVYGMPYSIAQAGLADLILPLAEIGPYLMQGV